MWKKKKKKEKLDGEKETLSNVSGLFTDDQHRISDNYRFVRTFIFAYSIHAYKNIISKRIVYKCII